MTTAPDEDYVPSECSLCQSEPKREGGLVKMAGLVSSVDEWRRKAEYEERGETPPPVYICRVCYSSCVGNVLGYPQYSHELKEIAKMQANTTNMILDAIAAAGLAVAIPALDESVYDLQLSRDDRLYLATRLPRYQDDDRVRELVGDLGVFKLGGRSWPVHNRYVDLGLAGPLRAVFEAHGGDPTIL